MNIKNAKELVLMHGPCFSGSGEIVERKVTVGDAPAYRRAGYENGPIPELIKLRQQVAAQAIKDAQKPAQTATKTAKNAK